MRILQLISSSGFYGAENVVLELVSCLNKMSVDCYLGAFNNIYNPHLEIIQHAREKQLKTKIFECSAKMDFKTVKNLSRFIKQQGIQILHSHGYKTNFYGLIAARLTGARIISTCHNWTGSGGKGKFYDLTDKLILPHFDQVVGVSGEIVAELSRIKVPQEKTSLIHNGVNISKFTSVQDNLRQEFDLCGRGPIVGAVARMTEEKGLLNLVQAAKPLVEKHPGIIFFLAGDGPQRVILEKRIKELKLEDYFVLAGTRKDIPAVLATIDFLVIPSLMEGLPMTLLEALAARRPVVATQVGEIPRLIRENDTGFLVPPGDIDALSNALDRMICNPGNAALMAGKAFLEIQHSYTSEKMANLYLDRYKILIKKGHQMEVAKVG